MFLQKHGNCLCNTTGTSTTLSMKRIWGTLMRQFSQDHHKLGGNVGRLKHDLFYALTVGWCQKFCHVTPNRDDSVRDGQIQFQDTALALSLVTLRGVQRIHYDDEVVTSYLRRRSCVTKRTEAQRLGSPREQR